jgi:hypothetical protein
LIKLEATKTRSSAGEEATVADGKGEDEGGHELDVKGLVSL